MSARDHRRHRRRQEGTRRSCRRHPRERAVLEGIAARSQAARSDNRTAARRRRWRAWLLESDRSSVAEDICATLLGTQDDECLEQAAQEPASKGQACVARHLDGGDQARRRGCIRWLHRVLRPQVREGCRVPQRRSRPIARLLRLSSRALEAPTNDESDREHVRNCAASHDQIKGLPLEQDRTRYDLQARASGGEELASSARLRPVAESHLRCKVQQRNRGRQIASSNRRRLTRPSPRFGDSSPEYCSINLLIRVIISSVSFFFEKK